jgi:capsular polysaccharide biosynthesis protein
MSQRSLNARQVVQIVRRNRILVSAVTVFGLLAGAAYSVLSPPLVTSTALVVLPGKAVQTTTQVVIVGSEPVLSRALPAIHPSMSLQTLKARLNVQIPAAAIISVSVAGGSADQANSAANAVAASYIAYVQNPRSPAGHITAQLLQSATPGTGTGAPVQDALDAVLGALAGLVAGTAAAIIRRRRSGRLFALDDMASSIGVPVLAAVSVANPAEAADWARLLTGYEPGPVDAWRLRQALLELGVTGPAGQSESAVSVTMMSLPSDPAALALGPQLAAFAASLEIPTLLVVGAQRSSDATAALYTACAAPDAAGGGSRYLRTVAAGAAEATDSPAEKLVIVVAVVDGEKAQLDETTPTATAVLGVSAGAATAEQLARLAMAATAHGGELTGLFVADPDPADRTSGRFPRPARQAHRAPAVGPSAPASKPAPESAQGPERDKSARLDFSGWASVPSETS